jgi:hypothetical protein
MARSSIWFTVVSILATFNIDRAVDEAGRPIEPTFEYLSALVRYNNTRLYSRLAPLWFLLIGSQRTASIQVFHHSAVEGGRGTYPGRSALNGYCDGIRT